MIKKNAVIVLQELAGHPNSLLPGILKQFEKPSIIRANKEKDLEGLKGPPVLNTHHLVIFDNMWSFNKCCGLIKFKYMVVVLCVEFQSQVDEAVSVCLEKGLSIVITDNLFTKVDAVELMLSFEQDLSDKFCTSLIKKVGLRPTRLMQSMDLLSSVGYTQANINKYIESYVYLDLLDVIDLLLHYNTSDRKYKRVIRYLDRSKFWFEKYTSPQIKEFLSLILEVYLAITECGLAESEAIEYAKEKKVSYRYIHRIFDYFETVPFVTVMEVQTRVADNLSVLQCLSMIQTGYSKTGLGGK